MQGAQKRLEREHDARAWLAWHTAYLPRAKRPPKLKDMLIGKSRRQSVEEQIAAAHAWTAAIQRQSETEG